MELLPPWQSVQPSLTAGFKCIVVASVCVWHVRHPALLDCTDSSVWLEGDAGAVMYLRSTACSPSEACKAEALPTSKATLHRSVTSSLFFCSFIADLSS